MGLPDEDKPTGYRYANGKLKADFEIIRTLAHNRGATWTEKATESHSKVASTTLTASSFSAIDSCKEFGTVYAAAKKIYEDTLKGVEQDVKEYQDKLLQVAKHLEDRDNRAGDVFAGLAGTHAGSRQDLHADAQNKQANSTKQAEDAESLQEQAKVEQQDGSGQPTGQAGDNAPVTPPDTAPDNSIGGPSTSTQTDDGKTQVKASR
ncbi:hypothetical protein RKE38_01605 [Phycicoccus sp. M110.8]|uniref:hypothetical protein n=1 Tax=Phycicoccus sp. M110.8 TaxID=3075433 RepID=UPI0028FD96E4|nr:hypothetical protein [Phycicoccus sp. M110.8]MDU0312366.1 hypothetical protein [Phycicoccus sp. M110.8]